MKNLFISFVFTDGDGKRHQGNGCVSKAPKVECMDDIISLQEHIKMAHGLQNVVINNWRRME